MTRRLTIASIIAINAVLLATTAVAAKGEGVARLAAPLPRDAEPGSTLTVHWTLSGRGDGTVDPYPFSAQGAYIKLIGSLDVTEAFGTESPLGSGNYVAEIVVPQSGIVVAEFGIAGISTVNGVSERSNMVFAFEGQLLQADVPPAVQPKPQPKIPATPAEPTATSQPPAPTISPIAVLGALAVVLAAAGTILTLRRRTALA